MTRIVKKIEGGAAAGAENVAAARRKGGDGAAQGKAGKPKKATVPKAGADAKTQGAPIAGLVSGAGIGGGRGGCAKAGSQEGDQTGTGPDDAVQGWRRDDRRDHEGDRMAAAQRRGFFAGTVRKKLGFELTSDKPEGGERRYAIKVVA